VLINWFTVFAQIINFLILVFLLKKFLYGPIIKAMAERERKMAEALESARQAEEEARRRSLKLEEENRSFTASKERLMDEARKNIEAWREDRLKNTRDEVEKMREIWIDTLNREKQDFLDKLKSQIVNQVVRISQKALTDLADDDLENRVINVFLEHMENPEHRSELEKASGMMRITTGFELEEKASDQIGERLAKWFPQAREFEFEYNESLGIGLEILIGDRKMEWNLGNYLVNLEQEIMTGLFEQIGRKNERL
jgi:F-type H+-transporting ATPase subunit b